MNENSEIARRQNDEEEKDYDFTAVHMCKEECKRCLGVVLPELDTSAEGCTVCSLVIPKYSLTHSKPGRKSDEALRLVFLKALLS